MATIFEVKERYNRIDIFQLLDECIIETSEILLDLNRSQLSVGIDSNNNKLEEYKSKTYSEFKVNVIGSLAPLGVPDLKLFGDFYRNFKEKINESNIIITSNDSKTVKLEAQYGTDIFGLTNENLIYYSREIILPLLTKKIKDGLL